MQPLRDAPAWGCFPGLLSSPLSSSPARAPRALVTREGHFRDPNVPRLHRLALPWGILRSCQFPRSWQNQSGWRTKNSSVTPDPGPGARSLQPAAGPFSAHSNSWLEGSARGWETVALGPKPGRPCPAGRGWCCCRSDLDCRQLPFSAASEDKGVGFRRERSPEEASVWAKPRVTGGRRVAFRQGKGSSEGRQPGLVARHLSRVGVLACHLGLQSVWSSSRVGLGQGFGEWTSQ